MHQLQLLCVFESTYLPGGDTPSISFALFIVLPLKAINVFKSGIHYFLDFNFLDFLNFLDLDFDFDFAFLDFALVFLDFLVFDFLDFFKFLRPPSLVAEH